jgi:regulatory protein SWI6
MSSQISAQPPTSSANQSHPHKRNRDEVETEPTLSQDTDVTMVNGEDDDVFSNPRTTGGQPPFKKARTDRGPPNGMDIDLDILQSKHSGPAPTTIDPKALSSVSLFPPTTILPISTEPSKDELEPRPSTMPTANRIQTADAIRRSTKRAALYSALQRDEPSIVIPLLLEQGDEPMLATSDIDAIVDSKGHTALHIASALGRLSVVEALVSRGADVHRGNYRGETPLMRAILTTVHYQAQTFESLLRLLRQSIRTTDEAKRSILHHVVHIAGVLGRVPEANYYLASILLWIGKHQHGQFDTLVDLRDENEDTALNLASRLGLKMLASTLITFGAKQNSANRFGMKADDYGLISKVGRYYLL